MKKCVGKLYVYIGDPERDGLITQQKNVFAFLLLGARRENKDSSLK